MRKWIEPPEVAVPEALEAEVGGHPLVLQTLARRGLGEVKTARAFLDPECYTPASPLELPGMHEAAGRLERAIRGRETICVWGDFDVDGQTATTLLVSALRDLGASVTYHIPVRERESHGVSLPVLSEILDMDVDLVLTCDTGIASNQAILHAQQRGVDVIVTDHHDLPAALPQAFALVNPKMTPEGHALSTLPGVGVAYKLVEELYHRAGRDEGLEDFLDLVALGIVADIAVQTGDTRYLLQRGLQVLRNTRRLGLQIMMEQANLDPTWLSEEHIGFVLGPRMNALGRLSDANSIVELLTTDDASRARILALELEGLNARRKLLTDQVFQGALAQIDRDPSLIDNQALVLAHPSWPAGVIGIVASRLVERYNKPVILISTPPGELGRGSARSVEGVHITNAIAAHQEMLAGFGGHPMAAGLSIDPENVPEFRRALSRTVADILGDSRDEITLSIDGFLSLSDLSLDLVADLERLSPFGPGNPALTLASRELVLKSHSKIGRGNEHLLLTVGDDQGMTQRVVWWQGADWPLPQGRFDLAYVVRASTYRGQREVQVEWVDARPVEEPVIEIETAQPEIEVVDYRREPHPLPLLKELQAQGEVQVWCEAGAKELDGRGRSHLTPANTLVIWTTPPGRSELQCVLEEVSPNTLYLFAKDPGMDHPKAFLERLTGLVKYALNAKQGYAQISELAVATAQRETTVQAGIAWLQAKGIIRVKRQSGSELWLEESDCAQENNLEEAAIQLRAMLDETAAYRTHFTRADKDALDFSHHGLQGG